MRGQVKIEFLLAIVAFAIVAFAVATQINSTFNIVAGDSLTDTLRTQASGLIELLVSEERWLSNGEPFSLSAANLTYFNTHCDLLPARASGYSLTVANSTHTLLRCGSVSINPRVSVSRIVWIEHDYGTITMGMG